MDQEQQLYDEMCVSNLEKKLEVALATLKQYADMNCDYYDGYELWSLPDGEEAKILEEHNLTQYISRHLEELAEQTLEVIKKL